MARKDSAAPSSAVARRPPGKKRDISAHLFPRNDRDRKFCECWLRHFDHLRAYREAGFATASNHGKWAGRALDKLKRFSEYLRPLREAKAREVAEKIVMHDQDVLEAMARKAVFNPLDYIERTATPLVRMVKKDGQDQLVEETITWDGKPVHGERLRPISELTREQAAAVEVVGVVGGVVQYKLPSAREQHQYLTSIGRQLGMFLEKIIMEKQNHQHRHAHLHLENVPTERLQTVTRQLLPLVGQDFATQLGYSQEEIEEAIAEFVDEPEHATGQ